MRTIRSLLLPSLIFGAACLCIVGLYGASDALFNQYDDAYITYRYALQLARGNGLVYNIGERIDSASSLGYTVVLAAFYWLGSLDLQVVATYIGIASAGGLAVVVFYSIVELTKDTRVALAFAMFTVLHGLISGWAISGMESVPYALLVALGFFWGILRRECRPRVGLVLSLALITRPEASLLIGCWFLATAGCVRGRDRQRRSDFFLSSGMIAVVAMAFLIFKLTYYGSLVPDAFRFKRVWSAYQPRPEELLETWTTTSGVCLIAAVGGIGLMRDLRSRIPLIIYLAASAYALGTGPRSGWARYSVHLLPIVMVLAGACVASLWKRATGLAWAFVLLIGWQTSSSANDVKGFMEKLSRHQQCRKQIGVALQRDWRGKTALSSDIGAIAFEAIDVRFVDAVGLTSPEVLRVFLDGGSLDAAFAAGAPDIVADTWYPDGKGPKGAFQAIRVLSSPDGYTPAKVSPPGFLRQVVVGKPLVECRAPDGYLFAASALLPVGPEPR